MDDWLLYKRLVLYGLALTFTMLAAVALELPNHNGAKKHLRLLAWTPVTIWSGLLLGGIVKICHAPYICADLVVTVMVIASIILSALFLRPLIRKDVK